MAKQQRAQVIISANTQGTLLLDVHKRGHIEACGLLLGSIDESGNWYVEQAHPLRNIFDSPVYFEFAPEELLSAELAYPDQIVGVYHSHPAGLAIASSTDRQNMKRVNVEEQIPWVWLIISGPFDTSPTLLQKVRRGLHSIAGISILAYHHYEHTGLRRIPIQFEELPETKPPETE